MVSSSVLLAVVAVCAFPLLTAKDIGCDAPKPEFIAPGRRISVQKCLEYNWERKKIEKCSKEPVFNEYPYMGALAFKKENKEEPSFLCSAFLISPKFAVTTAVCLTNKMTGFSGPEFVRFGHGDIKSDVRRYDAKILRTIPHPDFVAREFDNDIGLIELETPRITRNMLPACLWTQPSVDVEDAKSPSWGREKHAGMLDIIKAMDVKVSDWKVCESMAKNKGPKSHDRLICGDESASPVQLCQGTSGSPLVIESPIDVDSMPHVIGVSSAGIGCGKVGFYTKMSSYIDWIEKVVWP